jgi:hypothetical protein
MSFQQFYKAFKFLTENIIIVYEMAAIDVKDKI